MEALARLRQLYAPLWAKLSDGTQDAALIESLQQIHFERLENHGDFGRWSAAMMQVRDAAESLDTLEDCDSARMNLDKGAVHIASVKGDQTQGQQLHEGLMGLRPWRKGPWQYGDIRVDSEWRCDWKYERLRAAILPFVQEHAPSVLDVGCGNGYYIERLILDGARFAVGVDPSVLFVLQHCCARLIAESPSMVLALNDQQIDHQGFPQFDLVLSMGVLYHRKDPRDHLMRMWRRVAPGGMLVVETLIVDEQYAHEVYPLSGRYAKMRNVHWLPTVGYCESVLQLALGVEPQLVDVSVTTTDEQRNTDWMQFESLPQFLNPEQTATIEGHPLPTRAMWVIRKP